MTKKKRYSEYLKYALPASFTCRCAASIQWHVCNTVSILQVTIVGCIRFGRFCPASVHSLFSALAPIPLPFLSMRPSSISLASSPPSFYFTRNDNNNKP